MDKVIHSVVEWGIKDSEQPRDPDGKFASGHGGKTTYAHTSSSSNVSRLKRELGEKKAEAFKHANFLKEKGHEGVKVTSHYQAHAIPGKGIGGTQTYTVHHGQPKAQ